MKLPTIRDLIHDQAKFFKYQDGKLWYQIIWSGEEDAISEASGLPYKRKTVHLFDFPVPIDDAGGGEFGTIEKPITLMRWIRKHLEYLNGALAEGVYDQ